MKIRKWLAIVAATLLVLVGAIAAWALANAERSERPVGFAIVRAQDGAGKPMVLALWYPTSGTPRPTTLIGASLLDVAWEGPLSGKALPLVVISHGNGGGPGSHADLAMALASAGNVVAAPVHAGDNVEDSSGVGKTGFWSGRNAELLATVDFMLNRWPEHGRIDPARVGAFGFSAGGFTVLTAAGARPDMAAVARQCQTRPEFVCEVLRASNSGLLAPGAEMGEGGFRTDPRFRAIVVAAPGLGFTMANRQSLEGLRVPVQLWAGSADDRAPPASNAELIRAALPVPPEYHAVDKAGHLSFLAPCRLVRPALLCSDPAGFDRAAFHAEMNRQVIAFFARSLPPSVKAPDAPAPQAPGGR